MSNVIHILVAGLPPADLEELNSAWKEHGGVCHGTNSILHHLQEISEKRYQLIATLLPTGKEPHALRHIEIIRGISTIPIIAATYGDFDPDLRTQALEAGADQFHVFPLTPQERVGIARALLRRYLELNKRDDPPVTILFRKNLIVSVEQRIVLAGGREVALLPREFDILCLLIEHPGRWYTAEQIYEQVWDTPPVPDANKIVYRQVYNLREKLRSYPGLPQQIRFQRGAGYQFNSSLI